MQEAGLRPLRPVLSEDIQFILEKWEDFGLNRDFRGESILLTGGTGFFGKWLTQALMAAEERWPNGNSLTLLTRDERRTRALCPWLGARVKMIEGDVRSFSTNETYTTIIHGAASASQTLNEGQPLEMFDSIVSGTRHVLEVARASRCQNFQFISSGAVYGTQPPTLSHVSETYVGAPDPLSPKSAYGEAKRAAEFMAGTHSREYGFHLSVPRCFAFLGAHLPLDIHFAAGNFIRDVLRQESIRIQGDGSTIRSYMYAADLVLWLMVLLLKGESRCAYNVGADQEISLAHLAESVHQSGVALFPSRGSLVRPVQVAKVADPDRRPDRYVPSTTRAQALGLKSWTTLEQAINKTLRWHMGL